MQLIITPQGTGHCIYGEEIDLHALGSLAIARGSYVEPDAEGRWYADLSPAAGPYLGPYDRRTLALEAETTWLEANWLAR